MWAEEAHREGARVFGGGLPVGAVSEGGWRLVAGVGGGEPPLWVHPGLARVARSAPSLEDEEEGRRAREEAEGAGAHQGPAEEEAERLAAALPLAPPEPTPYGEWVWEGEGGGGAAARYAAGEAPPAHFPWFQPESGARAALPPPGARLPGGWAAIPGADGTPHSVRFHHAATGRTVNSAPAAASARARPPQPPPLPARPPPPAGEPQLWARVRGASGVRVWEETVSGARLPPEEGPPVGARMRGGWVVVEAGASFEHAGVADARRKRAFLHEARGLVRDWAHVPEEADEEWAAGGAWREESRGAADAPPPPLPPPS